MAFTKEGIVYSIIIPHFNLAEGLERCIQSIPSRPDVEVIVVDDVSDPDTIERLKNIESRFAFVSMVYSKVKGYGGRARNIGLSLANGKYVLFSDADDYFTSNLNKIFDEYKNTDNDITFFKTNKLDEDTRDFSTPQHHVNDYIDLWEKDSATAELYLRYMFGEPWCKLIKREIIKKNQISFDEVRINNDTTFSYKVGYHAKTIGVDKRAIYNYMVRPGSTSRQRDLNRLFIKIDVFGRSNLFFREHDIPLQEDRQYMALGSFVKERRASEFKKGMEQLMDLGYSKKEIQKHYSKTMAVCKLPVPIWNLLFAPDYKIKVFCLYYWFVITIPRFVKYNILHIKNNELRRY